MTGIDKLTNGWVGWRHSDWVGNELKTGGSVGGIQIGWMTSKKQKKTGGSVGDIQIEWMVSSKQNKNRVDRLVAKNKQKSKNKTKTGRSVVGTHTVWVTS